MSLSTGVVLALVLETVLVAHFYTTGEYRPN